MKHKLTIIIAALLAGIILVSCKSSTYAQKRKEEKAKLASYIQNNGVIVKEGAEDSLALLNINGPWPDKTFFKTYCGAYVRIAQINQKNRKPEEGNTLVMRWQAYDLDNNLTGDNTNPTESREGTVFVYTPGTYTPSQGWNSCIPFMRHNCQAEFIIESPIGPDEQVQNVITLFIKVLDFTVGN